jgi:hypothetical protein
MIAANGSSTSHSGLVSLRQYWAEVHTDLAKLGDRAAGVEARAAFDALIRDHPWFTAAFVQRA